MRRKAGEGGKTVERHPALERTQAIRREIVAGREVYVQDGEPSLFCDFSTAYWPRVNYQRLDAQHPQAKAVVDLCEVCARRIGVRW